MKRATILAPIIFLIAGCSSHMPYKPDTSGTAFSKPKKIDLRDETDRMIVSSATIRLKSLEPDSVHNRVMEFALSCNGYILYSGEGKTTIRVPAVYFKRVMSDIETLGEVLSREITGKDVTEEYHDLQTRLDNAEKTRQRYLALLDKAKNLEEILRIERELERLGQNIEQLKGKIERLSHIVAYSSITVETTDPARPGPVGYVFYGLYKGIEWLFVRN
ncbi:MAG: DUF4349 domain-containing protein [Candidatus Zixiibacteriota bacterium]|nr:MAG: DUF4349 domain-containing protein [candidate division Zixibacteria bacterium]